MFAQEVCCCRRCVDRIVLGARRALVVVAEGLTKKQEEDGNIRGGSWETPLPSATRAYTAQQSGIIKVREARGEISSPAKEINRTRDNKSSVIEKKRRTVKHLGHISLNTRCQEINGYTCET